MTPTARITRALIGIGLLVAAGALWLSDGFQLFGVALLGAAGLLYVADSLFGKRLFDQGYAWSALVGWLFFAAATAFSVVVIAAIAAGWIDTKYPESHAVIAGMASIAINGYIAVTKFPMLLEILRTSEDRTVER